MICKHAARKSGTRDRLVGLLAYLAGSGRNEEHRDQRLVAAWDSGLTDIQLRDPAEQMNLAETMEWPAQAWDMDSPRSGFVYHLPISLHADDPQLSDEQWAYVARKAISKLGFEDCRWVAAHHGLAHSEEGPRDHLHLVIHRAREDGTVASTWNDYKKLGELRAEMEDDPTLGLVVKTNRRGGGRSGWDQGERYRVPPEKRSETDRERLERLVRSAVAPAGSEADWVHGMRQAGVLVRPRYAQGGQSEVVGYSVALPPQSGQKEVWYGGGKLAKDLTLTAVRHRWDGHDPADSLSAWAAAAGTDAPATGGPRTKPRRRGPVTAEVRAQRQHATDALSGFEQAMLDTPITDENTWRAYARETAETLATLSTQAPATDRDTLARSARALARTAEGPHGQPRGHSTRAGSAVRDACRVIASGALAGQGGMATVIQLAHQLQRLSTTIERAQQARRDASAARLAAAADADLYTLHQAMSARSSPSSTTGGPRPQPGHTPEATHQQPRPAGPAPAARRDPRPPGQGRDEHGRD